MWCVFAVMYVCAFAGRVFAPRDLCGFVVVLIAVVFVVLCVSICVCSSVFVVLTNIYSVCR